MMTAAVDDSELLRRYLRDRSEAAFAELVQRHVNLVYSGALRRLGGNADLARDVAQQVFIALASQAATLVTRPILAGWLHTTTRNQALLVVRTERRRHQREQEAHAMNESNQTDPAASADWQRLRPVLDEALDELDESDREAVLLRFFEGHSFGELGRRLGLAENTARMRVERALDRMQAQLARRGVTSTVGALALVLGSEAAITVPAGLASTLTGVALPAALATSGVAGGLTFLAFMNTAKIISGAATVAAVVATGVAINQAAESRQLRTQLDAVRQEQSAAAAHSGAGFNQTGSAEVQRGSAAISPSSPAAGAADGRWDSPADVETWLRSTGMPLRLRFIVAQAILGEKYGAISSAMRYPPGMKRWQRSFTRPTPEQEEQMSALRLEQTQELQRIFGADYAKANFSNNIEQITGIPAEKLVEINRVRLDYMETRRKLGRNWSAAAQQLADKELNADLAKFLTPAELELYQAYDTDEAQAFQRSLAGLDISDETYIQLFRTATAAGSAAQLGTDQITAIEKGFGPDVAAHLAMNQNVTFREIGTLYVAAKFSSVAMLERYALFNKFHEDLQNQSNAAGGKQDEERKTLVRSYYARMTENLSPSARADFDRTNTGRFMNRQLGGK